MSNKVKAKPRESGVKHSVSIILTADTLKIIDREGEINKRKRATQIAYVIERWEESVKNGTPFC